MHQWFSVIAGIVLLASACTPAAQDTAGPPSAQAFDVTIMTFNVENLFDNDDDAGKDDRTYFALDRKQTDEHKTACATITVRRWREQCLYWDWSDTNIDRKLAAIAAAILHVNDGTGADIIALQEVENIKILERLRTDYLMGSGYFPAILIEGQDNRGIDVAFLSKLPLADSPLLHALNFSDEFADRTGDTRGILQADFLLPDGSVLSGFSVHFPAPFHPTGMRETAYQRLSELKAALPAGRPAFAAGDFNTTSAEDRDKNMLGRLARPDWTVVHEQGCPACRGTQYYAPDDSWSFLDMILWSPGELRGTGATPVLRKDSIDIANHTPEQVSANGTPARFSLPEGTGVSDHWPLVVTIEFNRNNSL
jgi:endonuclease/exonuclease/phosphatase family metal-dependent hydrolase